MGEVTPVLILSEQENHFTGEHSDYGSPPIRPGMHVRSRVGKRAGYFISGELSIERYIGNHQSLVNRKPVAGWTILYQWFVTGMSSAGKQWITSWAEERVLRA